MKKRLSKTGKQMWRITKPSLHREYMAGYFDGEKYLQSVISYEDFTPELDKDWTEEYREGYVDGYNDNLETMRIE